MNPVKQYFLKKKLTNQQAILGVVALVLGTGIFMLSGQPSLIGLATLFLVMSFANKSLKVVQVFPKYIEFKKGLIASKTMIPYDTIKSVLIEKKVFIIYYKTNNNKEKKFKFHKVLLEDKDLKEVISLLQENIPQSEKNQIENTVNS
ncbi:hypothetical protein HN014_15465 [Aquimarina sp. TRL1]|uniref:hypothetical protein n=1 Tax=Aquimarina sp. (strain TRL1) TaxID=2736252 RepID=UPI001589D38B|nr:hypothetical protein [Aquimarina sp. TRL1]QKX06249.1 hypothetical protein HN014_15465 [Aquimarina sp. TRL1]